MIEMVIEAARLVGFLDHGNKIVVPVYEKICSHRVPRPLHEYGISFDFVWLGIIKRNALKFMHTILNAGIVFS